MKIVVVGGGTAGVMAATYFRAYWGDLADITMIYDHKRPGIGVGESLTPIFDSYLKAVGVSTIDLIKNCNATIKLGLKFTNWTHEGSSWFHGFPHNESYSLIDQVIYDFNAVEAYQIANDENDSGWHYGQFYFDKAVIPSDNNLTYRHALHVDANLVGRYIEKKYKDVINVVDGIVDRVDVENRTIKSIKLADGREFTADLFIDASGLEKVLFKHLDVEWTDLSKDLPTDRTIPNPLFKQFDSIPPYTVAEATKNGWILDVPLSNRHGTGYVYSSKFTTDEEAKKEFDQWLKKTYNVGLGSDRVIKFSSGYHKEQWVGNCVSIGLASGFVEPLEATNIHHTFIQIDSITKLFTGVHSEFLRKNYNTRMRQIYDDSFRYIRFFYHTRRTDSEFWKYMSSNLSPELIEIEDLMSNTYLSRSDFSTGEANMFESADYNCVGYGHGLYKNKKGIENYLKVHHLYDHAAKLSKMIQETKTKYQQNAVDHKQWIASIIRQQ